MREIPWIERLAGDILTTTDELRRLVRRHHYDPPPAGERLTTRRGTLGGITISPNEARTLLRASMPAAMALPSRRTRHADLVAAVATFARELLDLNSIDGTAGDHAIAGAIELRKALTAWCLAMRWHQARTAAHRSWPTKGAITTLPRQSAAPDVPEMFDAPPAPARAVRRAISKIARQPQQLSFLLALATPTSSGPAWTCERAAGRRRASTAAAGDVAA